MGEGESYQPRGAEGQRVGISTSYQFPVLFYLFLPQQHITVENIVTGFGANLKSVDMTEEAKIGQMLGGGGGNKTKTWTSRYPTSI